MTRAVLIPLLLALIGHAAQAGSVDSAEALLRDGQVVAAEQQLRNHLEDHPEDLAAHELLIDIHSTTGKAEVAAALYRERAEQAPRSADNWYLVGRAEPRVEAATAAYGKALALDHRHARAWMGMGAVHRAQGEFPDAIDAYERALKRDSTLAEAHNGLIAVHIAAGDASAALAAARRATRAVPDDPDLWIALARVDAPNIEQTLSAAVARIPDDPRLFALLARTRFDGRDWKGAADAYQAALELQPAQQDLRVEAAMIDEIRRNVLAPEGSQLLLELRGGSTPTATALPRLDEVVSANPQSAWARIVRGNMLSSLAFQETDPAWRKRLGTAAEKDLREAIDRSPASPEAWAALGLYLLNDRQSEEAARLLVRAADARPHDVSLVVASAMAMAETGRVNAAELALREAQIAFPTSTGPTLGLARIKLAAGEPDAAYQTLLAAVRGYPHPDLVLALAAASREAGHELVAAELLDQLALETGDAHFSVAAEALRANAQK